MATDEAMTAERAKSLIAADVPVKAQRSWEIVDDEYRTGVHKPDWWAEVMADHTVFVPSVIQQRVKDAALREYARRDGVTLHTRREVVDGGLGTLYWITRKAK